MPLFDAPHGLTLVEQLRVLAGVDKKLDRFEITRDGCQVRVVWSPGSTDTLDLYVHLPTSSFNPPSAARHTEGGYRGAGRAHPVLAPRPLSITLRRETGKDIAHKERGVNRETQTGDPDFDDKVYIDSPSDDAAIRAVLASPDARDAVLNLLKRDCRHVLIDDARGDIALSIVEFLERAPDQTRAERLVGDLVRLAAALPPVRASGSRPVDTARRIAIIGCGVAIFIGIFVFQLYLSLSPSRCAVSTEEGQALRCDAGADCCMPGLTGALAGALASLPPILLLDRVIRGRSSSSKTLRYARIAVFSLVIELSIVIARLVW
jgi:hypothetical protein